MRVEAVLHLVRMGDVETGVWCGPCLLPSALRQVFEVWVGDGPGPGVLRTLRHCPDCGSTSWEDWP